MGHHRRVAHRGGLHRVLHGEVGADQQPAVLVEPDQIGPAVYGDVAVPPQDLREIAVPGGEACRDVGHRRRDVPVVEAQHPVDDGAATGGAFR
jgi:hypothetical protein